MRQFRDLSIGRTLARRGPGIRLPPRSDPCPVETIVARQRQQETAGGLAIASCSSGLLDVRLEGCRHPEVDHEADRRMIDSHAERVRRAHYPVSPPGEFILEARPRGGIHARVIRDCRYTPAAEVVGQTNGSGAGQDVDQRRRSLSLPK